MADIAWSAYALAMFTPEERAAAAGVVPPDDFLKPPVGPIPQPLGPSAPLGAKGTVDADQMFADGFVYIGGKWVRSQGLTKDQASAALAGSSVVGPPKPTGATFTSGAIFGGGSVLGQQVPVAPPVLLPNWVGGRIGVIREPGGYRPESGGTPLFPKPLGKVENWMKVGVPSGWAE